MPYCGSHTVVKTHGRRDHLLARLSCRAWTCPDCAPRRRRRLIAEIIGGQPTRFLTLTIRPTENERPIDTSRRLNKAWAKLRKWLCDYHRWKKLDHMTIVEAHKSGHPHLHIFLRCGYIHWERIADYWELITGSRHIYIQHLDNAGRGAAYAAKYAGKCRDKIGTAKRYYRSQTWERRPERRSDPNARTERVIARILGDHRRIARIYAACGWQITDRTEWYTTARPPP